MKCRTFFKATTGGFSLIEFMVALVLGFILIGGAVSVYLAAKRSYTEVEQVAALSENGRFALQILNEPLRHSGFFGEADPRDVDSSGLPAIVGDCSGEASAKSHMPYLTAAHAPANGEVFGCIKDAKPGTDVLVLKQVLPRPLRDNDPSAASDTPDGVISFPSGLSAQELYVIANRYRGSIISGADAPPDVGSVGDYAFAKAWPYRVSIYYVRDGAVPTLSRRQLSWNGAAMAMNGPVEDLVEGVENLRVMFGLTKAVSGEVERWVNYANVSGRLETVTAVEVFLLLRSATVDSAYRDEKTYQLGDLSITPVSNAAYDERARRLLVHSAVSLRNPSLLPRRLF